MDREDGQLPKKAAPSKGKKAASAKAGKEEPNSIAKNSRQKKEGKPKQAPKTGGAKIKKKAVANTSISSSESDTDTNENVDKAKSRRWVP